MAKPACVKPTNPLYPAWWSSDWLMYRVFNNSDKFPPPYASPPDGLTLREAEILGLIARGMTNPEIAAALFLSNHTIKTHISRIFAKTGSRDRAAAIGYAHRHNIG